MNQLEQAFNNALKKSIKSTQIKQVLQGIAVDIRETSCTVKREGAPDLEEVRLNAIDSPLEDTFTIYPKEGSSVIVGIIENMKTEAVLLRCSEVENIRIKCAGVSLVDVFNELIQSISNSIINTPSGTGTISPQTVDKLNTVNDKIKKIFI